MKCLVLGGNGFIGTHLVDGLLERGYSVRIYDRSPNRFRAVPQNAEYVEGELGNYGLIQEAVGETEMVFHFVGTTLPKTSNDDPIYDVRSNLIDTLQLLEACVEAKVQKVIFASSGGTIYGLPQTVPITEDHPTNPITSYGIVKLAVEKYLGLFHRLHTGQPITIWGDGSVVRDYLYVADLVEALVLAGETETRQKVFNVGSGWGRSLNELVAIMAEVSGEQPEVKYLPGRALDVPANVLDVSRVREELGWSPSTELTEGVARTLDWVRTLAEDSVEQEIRRR